VVDDPHWHGLVSVVDLPSHPDDRGLLTAISFAEHGFHVARAFVVAAPDGAVRGGHGHRVTRQLIVRVSGTIRVEVRHAGRVAAATLDASTPALLIEPGVWSRQTYLGDQPSLVVFCDTEYDPDDYVTAPEPVP
jgi:dTDP-4-dehydrorhamnose 3,5-epimerase-like enzyme